MTWPLVQWTCAWNACSQGGIYLGIRVAFPYHEFAEDDQGFRVFHTFYVSIGLLFFSITAEFRLWEDRAQTKNVEEEK